MMDCCSFIVPVLAASSILSFGPSLTSNSFMEFSWILLAYVGGKCALLMARWAGFNQVHVKACRLCTLTVFCSIVIALSFSVQVCFAAALFVCIIPWTWLWWPCTKCKRSITAWHATPKQNVKNIIQNGFKASPQGRLGPGVYFTNNLKDSMQIARSKKGAVIEVKIWTKKKMFNAGSNNFTSNSWQFGSVGIAKGLHPPCYGIRHPFTEFVKRNPRAIKVLKINGVEVRRGGGKGKGKVKGKFGKKGKGK